MNRRPSGTWAPLPPPRYIPFEEASRGKDLDHPIPYDPARVFAIGDVIIHQQLGVGVVSGVKEGGKIFVTFKQATRILIHGAK